MKQETEHKENAPHQDSQALQQDAERLSSLCSGHFSR